MAIETKNRQTIYQHPDGLHTAMRVTVVDVDEPRTRRTYQEADCQTDGAMTFITRAGGLAVWRCSQGDICL